MYVYFLKIKDQNLYKIGIATNLYNRIKSIQSSSPFEIKLLASCYNSKYKEIEFDLLWRYKKHKVRNKTEWYKLNKIQEKTLIEEIKKLDNPIEKQAIENKKSEKHFEYLKKNFFLNDRNKFEKDRFDSNSILDR